LQTLVDLGNQWVYFQDPKSVKESNSSSFKI